MKHGSFSAESRLESFSLQALLLFVAVPAVAPAVPCALRAVPPVLWNQRVPVKLACVQRVLSPALFARLPEGPSPVYVLREQAAPMDFPASNPALGIPIYGAPH